MNTLKFWTLVVSAFLFPSTFCLNNQTEIDESDEIKSYRGYKLIRLTPKDEKQLKFISTLEQNFDGEVDIWHPSTKAGQPSEILVSPEKSLSFFDTLKKSGLVIEVLSSDVQELLNEESLKPRKEASSLRQSVMNLSPSFISSYFSEFQNLRSINLFLDSLAMTFPRNAATQIIGESFEKRKMKIIKIGGTDQNNKPIIWIDAGIHAREWAAPPTALYIAYSLLSNYRTDASVRKLVDTFEWHILPSANPDGYVYTFRTDRMWRKTRSCKGNTCNSNSRCRGVDPNRNWSFHWREAGASSNPCSETYAGPNAFSEPETRAMANHIWKNRSNMKAYVSFHSYSQMWLTPWGYTSNVPPNFNDLIKKARASADAVARVYGTKYTVGSSTRVLYAAAGGSDDWALGVAKVPISYTIELRPSASAGNGFLLQKSQIMPNVVEMFEGIKQLAIEISKDLNKVKSERRKKKKQEEREN